MKRRKKNKYDIYIYNGKEYTVDLYRRRYSRDTIYTWIYINDEQACDPVRKIIPSMDDIIFAIRCYENKNLRR